MKFAAACALLAFVLVLPACRQEQARDERPASDRNTAGTDSLARLVVSVRLDLLRETYGLLSQNAHTRRTRTEQLDAEGTVIATSERLIRQTASAGTMQLISEEQRSSGSFRFGWFGRFAPGPDGDAEPFPLEQLLPENPAFLSARNRDDFEYTLLPMRDLGSRKVQVLEVRARSGERDQPIRLALLYLDPATREALALTMERVNPAILFNERSSTHFQIRQDGAGRWVPDRSVVETLMRLPLTPARHFRLATVYSIAAE